MPMHVDPYGLANVFANVESLKHKKQQIDLAKRQQGLQELMVMMNRARSPEDKQTIMLNFFKQNPDTILKGIKDLEGFGGGAFGAMNLPSGYITEYKVGDTGEVTTTHKPPSVGTQVGQYMSGLEPGSPEWREAAKLATPVTSITVGGEKGGYDTLDKANKAAMQWNKENPESPVEALPDTAPKGQGYIVKTIKKPQPPAEAQTQIRQLNAISRRVKRISKAIKPEHTGYWDALVSKGKIIAGTAPKELVQLDQNLNTLIDMVYALSGKQVNEEERKQIKKRFPRLWQPDANAEALLDGFMTMLADYADLTNEQWKALGYRSASTGEPLEREDDSQRIIEEKINKYLE